MLRRTALLALVALCAGCNVLSPDGDVEIRIRNASATAFDQVVVNFPDETVEYGAVVAQGSSEYHTVERAYRYARISVTVNGATAVLQPIDYVGEKLLDGGRYTYALVWLDGLPGGPQLGMEFERE